MGYLRRFLNLIVDNHEPGTRSLRCMDLKRLQLFYPTPPLEMLPCRDRSESAVLVASDSGSQKNKQVAGAAARMKSIRLPNPSFSFQASSAYGDDLWKNFCFPLAERKVVCMDQCGRNFLFDGDTNGVVAIPKLHRPKDSPISLFIPSDDGGGSLFIMERVPRPVICDIEQPSYDFEVLVYHKGRMTCQLLPPPPFVHERSYCNACSKIISYAVVGDGSVICISFNRHRGTYVLDTVRHTWNKVGNWMLPFRGKVEYVPELKLWFGLSADAHHCLAAADLSTMDMTSQPQLVGRWKELHPPKKWEEYEDAQLVYLGSHKFCIARFFLNLETNDEFDLKLCSRYFTAFTGVEVTPRALNGNANGSGREEELEMIPHKTRYHMPVYRTVIEKLF